MAKRHGTIREYASKLLRHVDFIDIYGRKIGYSYSHILALINERFPQSSGAGGNRGRKGFTYRALRDARDAMVGPRPARLISRRRLAREYTRSALLFTRDDQTGLSFQTIRKRIRAKFPEQQLLSLTHVERGLIRQGFNVPKVRGKADG